MKALLIVNPPEEPGDRQALHDALRRHFAAVHVDVEIHETRKGERPADFVRQRLGDGFDVVVAAGGDGTVSAVGDGLVGSSTPLAIIPTGTGNLLARELGIPDDLEAAVALIAGTARTTRKIDAMRIGGRVFILNAGVGISASIIGGTTRRNKGRFGRVAYVAMAILKVLSSRSRHLVVEVDGKAHRYRAVEVTVMNCGLLGGLAYPSDPVIRIDDGELGVWILSMRTLWGYARYVVGVIAGWTVNPEAHFISAQRTVNIRCRIPLPVQGDGDIIGTTPVSVHVLPGVINVLVSDKAVIAQQAGILATAATA